MQNDYGRYYSNAHGGRREVQPCYTVKKLKSGWLVYEMRSGQMFEIFPTKLRAYYAATRLNGKDVSFFFNFGTNMFAKQE